MWSISHSWFVRFWSRKALKCCMQYFHPQTLLAIYNSKVSLVQSLARTLPSSLKLVVHLYHSPISSWSILSSQIFICQELNIEDYIQVFKSYISSEQKNVFFTRLSNQFWSDKSVIVITTIRLKIEDPSRKPS